MDFEINVGDLLVAPPNMPDKRFAKSVMMITSHDEDHTMAVCVNRPTEYTVNKIIEPLGLVLPDDIDIFWGGPVSMQTVWMIHEPEWAVENTMQINDRWSLTSHESMFHHFVDGDLPRRYRFLLGHAGWGAGQLEMELTGSGPWSHRHSWLIAKDPDADWLINDNPDRLWSTATSLCSQQTVDHWLE